jgi:predicted HTH domain antitoxin
MATVTLNLPPEVDVHEAQLLLAIKLYEVGKLSLG